jgi:myo-inositol catabolism protein IolH
MAIDTSLLGRLPTEEALRKLSALGYKQVEVGLAHYRPGEATDEETAGFRKALADNHLGLAALIGIYPVSYADEEIRARGVKQFVTAIGRAKQLGCDLIASEMMGDAETYAECAAAFKKSMKELVPVLEREGVTLCYEAHPGDFTERNKIAVDLIREVGSRSVRYLYCTPHSFILGDDVSQMIEYARDILGYVHFADTLRPEKTFFSGRYTPKVPPHQHLTPGKGDVDLKAVVAGLTKAGYNGFVTVNPFSMFDAPAQAAEESLRALKDLGLFP